VKSRAVVRLARIVLHLLGGLLTAGLIYPFCSEAFRLVLKQRWSQQILEILGITVELAGNITPSGLLVSNHISFIDVFAINASMPSSFVAKDEVMRWPLIGWLAKRTDTLFLERGSRTAAQRARKNLVGHLQNSKRVVVFPEGTTSNGDSVLPFHGALFQAAIDAGVPVTPLAVSYADRSGQRSYAAAFVGDTTLVECLWSTACADGLRVKVALLNPLHPANPAAQDRRHLAAHAHHAISRSLSHSDQ
jgi:1-acyl-sn-glycerol-3-phosphate acyltransferase